MISLIAFILHTFWCSTWPISWHSIWHIILTFFLAFYLAYILTFFAALYLDLFWRSGIQPAAWHIFQQSFCTIWHPVRHYNWPIFWHSIWHSFLRAFHDVSWFAWNLKKRSCGNVQHPEKTAFLNLSPCLAFKPSSSFLCQALQKWLTNWLRESTANNGFSEAAACLSHEPISTTKR